jgi:hypothetical protein
MDPGPSDPVPRAASRLSAARSEFDAQTRRFEDVSARLQVTIDRLRGNRPRREMLRDSAFARLQARLDTMPVIEQAKGIVMAQHRCGPEEAFDLLRRASQRANIKLSVLAAQIVEQVALPDPQPMGNLPLRTSGSAAGRTNNGSRPRPASGRRAGSGA